MVSTTKRIPSEFRRGLISWSGLACYLASVAILSSYGSQWVITWLSGLGPLAAAAVISVPVGLVCTAVVGTLVGNVMRIHDIAMLAAQLGDQRPRRQILAAARQLLPLSRR